ncbi:protein translocase subunit [Tieghemiomyces parasiticus]|uniref:Mitochondrial import inner membrane translocase subunit TIM44 n=1 Tax=Tieghemiomyces parasiticus TaxID=78921 RepID=A0A9W8A7G8_9FUNG|nr:protein translocase subunit [Tieghemiomyces parasiticus]
MLPLQLAVTRPMGPARLASRALQLTTTLGMRHLSHTRPTLNRDMRSPVSIFIESIKRQVKQNNEFKDNIKLLQDEKSKIAESEAMKRAREAFSKANEKTSEHSEKIKKVAEKVGQSVSETYKDISETEAAKLSKAAVHKTAKVVSSTVSAATEPIRKTETYQHVSEEVKTLVDEGTSQYGGYRTKEEREKLRQKWAKDPRRKAAQRVAANPEAGSSVVMHKDSKWKTSWDSFKENSPVMQGLFRVRQNYDESENPLISFTRSITERVGDTFTSIFSESESAQALRLFKQTLDPSFNTDQFLHEAREFIIPEVIDAYLHSDVDALKQWCSEATFNVLSAGIQAQIAQGLVSDSRVLDIRRVDMVTAKVLENDVPVIVLSFNTQEVMVFRNRVSREIVFGKEDHIELVAYAMVLTKDPDDLANPVTNGWKVLEMAKQFSRPTW